MSQIFNNIISSRTVWLHFFIITLLGLHACATNGAVVTSTRERQAENPPPAVLWHSSTTTGHVHHDGKDSESSEWHQEHHHDHRRLDHEHDERDHEDHRCATRQPTVHERRVEQVRMQAAFADSPHHPDRQRHLQVPTTCDQLCEQCIEIDVHLHLILANVTDFGVLVPHPTEVVFDLLNDNSPVGPSDLSTVEDIVTLFQNNLAVANQAFVGTPFRFRFVPEATTQTVNNTWSNDAVEFQSDMSAKLGSGNLRVMDVFVAWNMLRSTEGTILGVASLPGAQISKNGDGMIVRYDVLTGGGYLRNSRGYTLVHEIGHWMGLLHTFQTLNSSPLNTCNPAEQDLGDLVADTPVQNGPSSQALQPDTCRSYLGTNEPLPDTCPDLPGRDALFNYMNYVDDDVCSQERGNFTCGQIERMYRHWLLFREHVTSCDTGEMEIEIVVALDENYLSDTIMQLSNSNGDVFFNSFVDHWVAVQVFDQETLMVDLCVPRADVYTLRIEDQGGDGFNNGFVEIYVDRRFVEIIKGNFGAFTTTEISDDQETISREPSSSPSSSPTITARPTEVPSAMPSPSPTVSPAPTASPTRVSVSSDGINVLGAVAVGLVSLVALCAAGICFYVLRARRKPRQLAIPSARNGQKTPNPISSSGPSTPGSASSSSRALPAHQTALEESYDV